MTTILSALLKIAVDHPLGRMNDALQCTLVFGSDSSVPESDGRGKDGLNDGDVRVHHYCLWQIEFLYLTQEEHPLLCLPFSFAISFYSVGL